MRSRLALVFAALFAVPLAGMAEDTVPAPTLWQADPAYEFTADTVDLNDFLWTARPVVVFADTPNDPRFQEQLALLRERIAAVVERDILIITDTNPDTPSEIRTKLRPRGFMMVLIGKDGGVKLRKPSPWSVREISRTIDKMPMRQQEIRERRADPIIR